MVVAVPSALCDSLQALASGLPSKIQDGSIGLGASSTFRLPISIRPRDIQYPQLMAKRLAFEANDRFGPTSPGIFKHCLRKNLQSVRRPRDRREYYSSSMPGVRLSLK